MKIVGSIKENSIVKRFPELELASHLKPLCGARDGRNL
jgi:hypothetical protein